MEFKVQGMTCGHCAAAVERAVERLGGRAEVDVAGGVVRVSRIEDAAAVREAIEREGYTVTDVDASG